MESSFFNKLAIKIALIFAIGAILLLIVSNYLLSQGGEKALGTALNEAQFDQFVVSSTDPNNPDAKYIKVTPAAGTTIAIPFTRAAIVDQYKYRFQEYQYQIMFIAILIAIVTAIVVSRSLTKPLRYMTEGMAELKNNNYRVKLMPTGTQEIDEAIEEFNKLIEELDRTENLRKELITDVTHELKTPLTSLSVQLEGVKDGVIVLDEKRVDKLLEQVNRLDNLIERMGEFSRFKNKTIKFNPESIELKKFVEEITKDFEDKLEEAKIKLNIEIKPELKIEADKNLLETIFVNLFTNAIKYSQAKNIFIKADEDSIEFSDDGIGVDKKDLKNIFERFYRVEKSRNRSTGGLGLGLAIVKEAIESHNWEIEAINDSGLKFRIYID